MFEQVGQALLALCLLDDLIVEEEPSRKHLDLDLGRLEARSVIKQRVDTDHASVSTRHLMLAWMGLERVYIQLDGVTPSRHKLFSLDIPRCLCPLWHFPAFDSHIEVPAEKAHFGGETARFDVCFKNKACS